MKFFNFGIKLLGFDDVRIIADSHQALIGHLVERMIALAAEASIVPGAALWTDNALPRIATGGAEVFALL